MPSAPSRARSRERRARGPPRGRPRWQSTRRAVGSRWLGARPWQDGSPAETAAGWTLTWVGREPGVARLSDGSHSELCLVEGAGKDWVVTLRGRRIPVEVRTWRERVLADAESAARRHDGPIEVRATLPGLVVAIAV